MRYEIPLAYTTSRGAKNKAYVSSSQNADVWVVCEADRPEDAFAYVLRTVSPNDKRPISGKSYVRQFKITPEFRKEEGGRIPINKLPKYKIGDAVVLHEPYSGGSLDSFKIGTISEVLSDWQYSISLKGYYNPFVDFSAREFAVKA
jgi:hypothetical protein